GELAVAAVEDRMRQEQEGADELIRGRRRQEERRAEQAEPDAHDGHDVRRDTGDRQPARDRQRDPSLEVARHEPLALLDQAAQEPRLGGSRVGRLAEWEASGVVHVELRLVEPEAQRRQQLADAATLRRRREYGRRVVGIDDRRQLSLTVEALGLDAGLANGPDA